jgi:hypothetical protein
MAVSGNRFCREPPWIDDEGSEHAANAELIVQVDVVFRGCGVRMGLMALALYKDQVSVVNNVPPKSLNLASEMMPFDDEDV